MNYLTPDQAVMARETLNLSQAKVARDTGINRAYLSQFEGSKRILEDQPLSRLQEYYMSLGWAPSPETSTASVKQLLDSDKHNLTIMDGFVVAMESFSSEAEAEVLLDEYYAIGEEIVELKQQELKRGFFGGLDESEALSDSLRALVLMGRQCEIKQMLQGQLEPDQSVVDRNDKSTVQTVGDFIEVLLQGGCPDRFIPVTG